MFHSFAVAFVFGQVKQQYPNLVMVDYTLPDVIHDMANLYIKHKTPFVMGVRRAAADLPAFKWYSCNELCS